MELSMINTLFFDFDHTLCPTDIGDVQGNIAAEKYLAKCFSIQIAEAVLRKYSSKLAAMPYPKTKGYCSHIWRENLLAKALAENEVPVCYAKNVYSSFINAKLNAIKRSETLIELLCTLKQQYKIAIVTNGRAELQLPKIRKRGLFGVFDYIAISGDVGYSKPNCEIFLHTCNMLSCRPEETVHIGDNLRCDIIGAYNAGLRAAIWLTTEQDSTSSCKNTPYTISDIAQLPGIINNIEADINEY